MVQQDIGAYIKAAAGAVRTAVAGGAGDATEVNGEWIDRKGYLSAKLVIVFDATLAQTQTLSLAANLQDASDDQGSDPADFGDALANAVVATGETGGSTEIGVAVLDIDLSGAKRYVRAQFTPNLSAGATDTARIGAVLILGGADVVPAV